MHLEVVRQILGDLLITSIRKIGKLLSPYVNFFSPKLHPLYDNEANGPVAKVFLLTSNGGS